MTEKTYLRVGEIRRRVRLKRQHREKRYLFGLSMGSIFLLAGVGVLLREVQLPGVVDVTDGYGSVLLRGGTVAYVVVGIAAFVTGAALTILCFRWKEKRANHGDDQEEFL